MERGFGRSSGSKGVRGSWGKENTGNERAEETVMFDERKFDN